MQNHDIGRAAIPTKTPGESPPWSSSGGSRCSVACGGIILVSDSVSTWLLPCVRSPSLLSGG